MLWICVHLSGLVCSHSVFETCWSICYRYVNNAAIYSLFSGKRGCSWPWPPGEAVCLRGNCICFGFLLKKVPSSTTPQGEVVFVSCSLARLLPLQSSWCPGEPKARLLGELSSFPCQVLKTIFSYKPENKYSENMPCFHLASLFLQPAWKWIFFPMVSLCLVC